MIRIKNNTTIYFTIQIVNVIIYPTNYYLNRLFIINISVGLFYGKIGRE